MFKVYDFSTKKNDVVYLNDYILEALAESNVKNGLCTVFTPHTTASVTITSYHDPKGFEDLQDEISRLVPTRVNFKHQHDTPTDASGHVKSSIVGVDVNLIVVDGALQIGHSQGIYFLEFDGPRNRKVFINIIGE